jgi:transposase InsO family protein
VPKEILTDNGRQYTVWRGTTRFEEEPRRQGIRHLKSRPQHPQTLGKVERFWKTLWDEFLSRTAGMSASLAAAMVGVCAACRNEREDCKRRKAWAPGDPVPQSVEPGGLE